MKLVDRINAWALRRLPSRRWALRLKSVDEAGLHVAGRASASGESELYIPWDSIDRVVATEPLVGSYILLLFSLKNGGVLSVPENDATFPSLTDELHLHLLGARRFADWSLELVGSGSSSVEVFKRAKS